MKIQCPRIPKCHLFNHNIQIDNERLENYKEVYCNAGEAFFKQCKRYLVSESVMKCADFVVPDSPESVDDLIERMVDEGVL